MWKAGEDNVVPDALSRIFGEIASRIEESEGIQIMNDQENVVSASALAQEARDSIAEVSATEELVPTENDSAPRWLSKCPRDGAGRFVVEKAWIAAIESAH